MTAAPTHPPRRIRRRLARFARHDGGATAVEFAIVSVPFFFLTFAIMDVGFTFVGTQLLENATQDVARMVMLGKASAQSWTGTEFRTAVCSRVSALMNCSKLSLDIKQYTGYSTMDFTKLSNPGVTTYAAGAGNAIMVMRVSYPWPAFTPNLYGFGAGTTPSGGTRLLFSTATFRNEAF